MVSRLLEARPDTAERAARRLVLGGRVQGVGFRPFVHRLAARHGLSGWVRNRSGEVEIHVEGDRGATLAFEAALLAEAPPLARPVLVEARDVEPGACGGFEILQSDAAAAPSVHVPPDQFACEDCLREMRDPADRRHRYPFTNCTQCGPRYTLIERLPYDRPNTSMRQFEMCPDCAAEYADPADRRFHAEPIACPACGPRLEYRAAGVDGAVGEAALQAAVAALHDGRIVAAKGVGGYHLLCDAANDGAVRELRRRKGRPDKPLAVMFPREPDLASLRAETWPEAIHEAALVDPVRPIVLVPKRPGGRLAAEIAPGVAEIGAMLPYSPLHELLLSDFGGPLVATSGNVSGEPVLTDEAEAERRLGHVADAFLHHDRPIVRPADDPVGRPIAGAVRPLRIGRGNAPLELELPAALPEPVLALGGHLKSTVALGWGDRAVVSPHLGDMESPRSLDLLRRVAADLQGLHGITAKRVVCDAHPGYATARLAPEFGLPVSRVFHHEAHASALVGEIEGAAPSGEDWLVFAWDGAGYGRDGTIWGGEALLGRPGNWRRVATLRPFALLGGDQAARDPWRNALSLVWETGAEWPEAPGDVGPLRHAWQRGINCPKTSSVGRLFDGAAALLGVAREASYEGQAASRLEAACVSSGGADAMELPLEQQADGVWEADWRPLVSRLLELRDDPAAGAALFHASLAEMVLRQARAVRSQHGVMRLGLSGGVFQNRVLCEQVVEAARREGFAVHLPARLPCNDAAIAFGQIVETAPGR